MKTVSIKYCFLALILVMLFTGYSYGKTSAVTEGSASIELIQVENSLVFETQGVFNSDYQTSYNELLFFNVQINYFYPGQSFALREESIRTVRRFSSYLQI